MQETRTLILGPDIISPITSDDDERLTDLKNELDSNSDLESMLGCYHQSGEVSYDIVDIQVNEVGEGFLEVNYIAHKYSACKDIDLDEDGTMIVEVSINMETGETTLVGEDWPERDPDTY